MRLIVSLLIAAALAGCIQNEPEIEVYRTLPEAWDLVDVPTGYALTYLNGTTLRESMDFSYEAPPEGKSTRWDFEFYNPSSTRANCDIDRYFVVVTGNGVDKEQYCSPERHRDVIELVVIDTTTFQMDSVTPLVTISENNPAYKEQVYSGKWASLHLFGCEPGHGDPAAVWKMGMGWDKWYVDVETGKEVNLSKNCRVP